MTNVSQMVGTLSSIRQPAIRRSLGGETINATSSPRDVRTAHLLKGSYTGESPEVAVGNPGEFLLDGFHEITGDVETRVGAVLGLGFESHGGIVAMNEYG